MISMADVDTMPIRRSFPMGDWKAIILMALLTGYGCDSASRENAVPAPQLPDLSASYPEVAEAVRSRFKIVKVHPDSAGAWGRYGMILDAHEFRDQCVVCYRVASQLDQADVRWRYYLALQLRNASPTQALAVLGETVPDGKRELPILLLKASLLREQGRNATNLKRPGGC